MGDQEPIVGRGGQAPGHHVEVENSTCGRDVHALDADGSTFDPGGTRTEPRGGLHLGNLVGGVLNRSGEPDESPTLHDEVEVCRPFDQFGL